MRDRPANALPTGRRKRYWLRARANRRVAYVSRSSQKVWFQSLPEGDVAVGYWEGDDPRAALKVFRTP